MKVRAFSPIVNDNKRLSTLRLQEFRSKESISKEKEKVTLLIENATKDPPQ